MALVADRRLCLTADRSEVVEEGDTRAAWLFVPAGRHIADADAERYGLGADGDRVVIGAKSAAKVEDKMVAAPENKAAKAPEPDPEPEPEPKEKPKPKRRTTRKRGG